MFADGILGLSAFIFVLALLDVFLSEAQKKQFANFTITLWSKLDEIRKISLGAFLKRPVAINIATSAIAFVYLWPLVQFYPPNQVHSCTTFYSEHGYNSSQALNLCKIKGRDVLYYAAVIVGVVAGLWLGHRIITRMLQRQATLHVLLFISIALIVAGLMFFGVQQRTYTITFFAPSSGTIAYVFSVAWAVATALTAIIGVLAGYWLLAVLLIVSLYLATALFIVCEFIVRRIAEYPKGPILAVSGLVCAIFALMKTFD